METLCASYASWGAGVAQELQLIRASVALGLYLKRNSPAHKDKVKNAMTTFLNSRVSTWVDQQGGWVRACLKCFSVAYQVFITSSLCLTVRLQTTTLNGKGKKITPPQLSRFNAYYKYFSFYIFYFFNQKHYFFVYQK